eukprot:jgi/Picsp_1/5925/NSC_03282-R1_threonine ammonia- catabolic
MSLANCPLWSGVHVAARASSSQNTPLPTESLYSRDSLDKCGNYCSPMRTRVWSRVGPGCSVSGFGNGRRVSAVSSGKERSNSPAPKGEHAGSRVAPEFAKEAIKYFVKRLESRGWDRAREWVPESLGREAMEGADSGRMQDVWRAMDVVYGLGVRETPLLKSPWLQEAVPRGVSRSGEHSKVAGETAGSVLLKMESEQVTGSFKARGAAFKIMSLSQKEKEHGVLVSSTGNHALAVLHAVAALKKAAGEQVALEMYLPETIASRKLSKIEREASKCGACVHLVGKDCVEAEVAAREAAERTGRVYISPYNDTTVIAGQGTIAMEILMERSPGEIDAVFVPVGGGGLIAGIGTVLKAISPGVKVFGCQPEKSDAMRRSIEAGAVVSIPWHETLSEGTAGGLEDHAVTLEECKAVVDHWVTVSEEEIAAAMVGVHGHHATQIEGAAAVGVAGLMKCAPQVAGKHSIVIICGGNVSSETLDKAYDIVRGGYSGKPDESDGPLRGEAASF